MGVVTAGVDEPVDEAAAVALLAEARPLMESDTIRGQLKGATLLLAAYAKAPDRLDTLAGACEGWFVRGYWSKDKAKAQRLGKRAAKAGRQIIKRWPKRAEGYYWAAVGMGLWAQNGSVMDAINQGVAAKIERLGRKAVKLNRALYRGAPLRLLGRYYFALPWPMKAPAKARPLLEEAHRLDPKNLTNLLYLGELLAELGDAPAARKLFQQCVQGTGPDRKAAESCKRALADS